MSPVGTFAAVLIAQFETECGFASQREIGTVSTWGRINPPAASYKASRRIIDRQEEAFIRADISR